MVTNETIDGIYQEIEGVINQSLKDEPRVKVRISRMQETRHCIPMETPLDHSLISVLQTVLSENGLLSEPQGVAYGTDAFWLSAFGIPSVVWGPGDILQAHSNDEYVALDQIWLATTMYIEAIMRLCGPNL